MRIFILACLPHCFPQFLLSHKGLLHLRSKASTLRPAALTFTPANVLPTVR